MLKLLNLLLRLLLLSCPDLIYGVLRALRAICNFYMPRSRQRDKLQIRTCIELFSGRFITAGPIKNCCINFQRVYYALFIRLHIIVVADVASVAAAATFQALKKVLQTYLHTRLWCVNRELGRTREVINICLCYIITFHYVCCTH